MIYRININFKYYRYFRSNIMPKKSVASKDSQIHFSHSSTQENGSIYCAKDGSIVLKILAKPSAKENAITDCVESIIAGMNDNEIGVKLCAPPIDGEANTELIKFLSSVLGIRKSDLSLNRGSKSRQKIVLVQAGSCTLESVKNKIEETINQ